jgi:CubicO group peptidase (beta-lactamase class C family)
MQVSRLGQLSVCIAALALPVPGAADWPKRDVIEPVRSKATPQPGTELPIEYDCSFFRTCSLAEFMQRVNVCALYVTRNGKPVLHRVQPQSGGGCPNNIRRERYGVASIAKSVTSLLFGKVFTDPAYGPPLDIDIKAATQLAKTGIAYGNKEATIRDLLRMSSGMVWSQHIDTGSITIDADADGNPRGPHRTILEAVRAKLESANFGSANRFNYSGFDSLLLGIMVEQRLKSIGQLQRPTLGQAVQNYFWEPLGMRKKAQWKADFEAHPPARCCLYMSAGDLALLGDWVLQQYLSGTDAMAKWIRQSVTDTVPSTRSCSFQRMHQNFQYGYQWWVLSGEKNGFTAVGAGGQFLHIFPDQNVVVVQLGDLRRLTNQMVCESLVVHRAIADHLAP